MRFLLLESCLYFMETIGGLIHQTRLIKMVCSCVARKQFENNVHSSEIFTYFGNSESDICYLQLKVIHISSHPWICP